MLLATVISYRGSSTYISSSFLLKPTTRLVWRVFKRRSSSGVISTVIVVLRLCRNRPKRLPF